MSRLTKLVVVVFVALCGGCAGTVVPLGCRGPAPVGAARTIKAEACGFRLLLLIPIYIDGRAERAYREFEEQAAGDFITNVQVRERWIWGRWCQLLHGVTCHGDSRRGTDAGGCGGALSGDAGCGGGAARGGPGRRACAGRDAGWRTGADGRRAGTCG